MDETACALDPPLVRCWQKRGSQVTVPAAAGSHALLHLFGGMDLVTGEVVASFRPRRTSDDFIAFLEELMHKRYPTQAVYLVLDNASFHTSAASQAAISLFEPRLQCFFLPPYAPECNPIERYWRHLKETALGNRRLGSLAEVQAALQRTIDCQNDLNNANRYQIA